MPLDIRLVPYGSDNYAFLVHDSASGQTACVDAGDADPVLEALDRTGWTLSEIWITHHHGDHVAGLPQLKTATDAHVRGPVADGTRIDGLDEELGHDDSFEFAGQPVQVIATPGHTTDMINFHLPGDTVVFTGDTLFVMGCGRIFEGTPKMMWTSLQRLAALPPETKVYCAHEYTLANARFALSVDPENGKLLARAEAAKRKRDKDEPTVPTTIGEELATNPFLRPDAPGIRAELAMQGDEDAEVFAALRARKDRF